MSENEPVTTESERGGSDAQVPASDAETLGEDRGTVAAGRGVDRAGLETLVRDGESVAGACPYCDRPFATRAAYDLHVGEVHEDACSASEREAYADALAAEEDELFYFHLRVVAGLAALYTVLVLVYMVALGSGFL
ncbi:DUF7410 domain-containing protein [Halorubellus litoreus]|uniref:DNA-binding protein n=1 Tax=Halorubellus litoreus TaxID=755308 RepID=A0ABD5VMM4_9EURY